MAKRRDCGVPGGADAVAARLRRQWAAGQLRRRRNRPEHLWFRHLPVVHRHRRADGRDGRRHQAPPAHTQAGPRRADRRPSRLCLPTRRPTSMPTTPGCISAGRTTPQPSICPPRTTARLALCSNRSACHRAHRHDWWCWHRAPGRCWPRCWTPLSMTTRPGWSPSASIATARPSRSRLPHRCRPSRPAGRLPEPRRLGRRAHRGHRRALA